MLPDKDSTYRRLIHIGHRLLLSMLVCSGIPSYAQTYFFDNYGSEQGLESSKVFSIIQAKDDYIWLGTKAGLSKFDGLTFQNYTLENGLARGGVRVIYEDVEGIIWFGHEGGGITRYNGKNFDSIYITDKIPNLNITSITYGPEGNLWVSTSMDGVYRIFNPHDELRKIRYDHFKGKKLSDRIFSSILTSDGTLYFVTDAGIRKFIPETNTFKTYIPKGLDTYFAISLIYEDSHNNFWFGTYNGGLYKQNGSSGKFSYYDIKHGLANNWISAITEDVTGNIWVGHWDQFEGGGVTRIDNSGNLKVFNTKNGLHDNKIWCIAADKEGNILIGTTEHGMDIFKGEHFITYTTQDGLINNQVSAITQDVNNRIWFGTYGGITVFNPRQKTFDYFTQQNNHISNMIRFLKRDADGNIWIGTSDQGVIKYHSKRNSFEYMSLINSNFPRAGGIYINDVYALETDLDNAVWVGTFDGLLRYDNSQGTIKTFTQINGLPGNTISSLYADSKNNLWIGVKNKGLTLSTPQGFSRIYAVKDVTPTCLTEDRNGRLWIGTDANGVLSLKDTAVERFTTHEGLLSNLINFIITDDNNNIYVGTNNGLNKIIPGENKIFVYTKKSGFTGIETKTNAAFKDHGGKLWFGTVNGVMCHDPALERKTAIEPLTHINKMLVNSEPMDFRKKLRLSHTEKQVAFQYSSICLSDPDAVRYRIMLEGWESEWVDMGIQNSIIYQLPPGNYTFKVIARNNTGNWNSEPQTVSFTILAPFYQRGWFIISAAFIVAFFIFMVIKIRERNLLHEKRVLETKVQERTVALSNANEQLAVRNKDITDSIKYAKRIQFAILPPDIPFDGTFILFKPKDIVSGDFYWLTTHAGKEFIAAVDCTGHGVPGAFMSFIGYTSLNKIVIEHDILEPAGILNQLNEEVASTLHQKGEEIVNDGMDIALICYDPEKSELQYAGAFNPLWILRDTDIIEVKANRFAIGRSTGKENEFTNHILKIERNDVVYLFSDGYSDQFGGDEGKKFKTKNFKDLLMTFSEKSMDEQRYILESSFEQWKGTFDQIDDVLVIGRKFF